MRYLVIANQTIAEQSLAEAIRSRIAAGPCHFHLVVPATPTPGLTFTDGAALALARVRLDAAVALLAAQGASVDGEIGDASPVVAATDTIRGGPALRRDHRLDAPARAIKMAQDGPAPAAGTALRDPGAPCRRRPSWTRLTDAAVAAQSHGAPDL